MNLYFDNSWALWFFAAIIPMIAFDLLQLTRRQSDMPAQLKKRLVASSVFFAAFLVFFVCALASPRLPGSGEQTNQSIENFRRGIDAVIALDVSRSMNIQDVSPNEGNGEQNNTSRLERGLSLALNTVGALPHLRYAAAIGRGRGHLAIPLTWDNNVITNFLESVDDGVLIGGGGTNLESLLDAAASAFDAASSTSSITSAATASTVASKGISSGTAAGSSAASGSSPSATRVLSPSAMATISSGPASACSSISAISSSAIKARAEREIFCRS